MLPGGVMYTGVLVGLFELDAALRELPGSHPLQSKQKPESEGKYDQIKDAG